MSGDDEACANPLFLRWVGEWYAEARRRNTHGHYALKKAHESLQRHPLRIENAQDTVQLPGIGQGTADRLAKKLASWRCEHGIVVDSPNPAAPPGSAAGSGGGTSRGAQPARGTQLTRIYVPRYRSGAFALLLGLLKTRCLYGPDYYIPKSELVPMSEQYTDTPFHVGGSSRGGGGGGYAGGAMQLTAWSGMKTLESKSLAERQSGVKFCLTDEGLEIAIKVVGVLRARSELTADDSRLFANLEVQHAHSVRCDDASADAEGCLLPSDTEETGGAGGARALRPPLPPGARSVDTTGSGRQPARSSGPTMLSRSQSSLGGSFSRHSSSAADVGLGDLVKYPAGEYDIMLVVDNREVHSTADRALIEKELEACGVRVEVRPLTVGDYLWIARAKPAGACKQLPDIVLDYVVERKRMDDLCASIRDGRYREQHARILTTGFTNVFYVVEGNDPDAVGRLGEAAVDSALSRIQLHHGFHLKRPPSFEATLRLLRQTTGILDSVLGDIYAIPDRLVGMRGFAELKKTLAAKYPHASLAMSFDAYDLVSNKSGSLSVGEVYLRMLMALRGMSADRALTIGGLHQTPAQLVDALDAAEDSAGMLGDLTINSTCRRIGPVLGKRVAQFWTASSFSASE
ncbi:Crossover junction endonuclease mus81 [Coemansia biformis]|uniref:Crossover junction endonuclease MUS81 n=1 Tax=Coemansia biformis TaxID=1286918 RepID=A0A9W7YBR5_9FUNG|nr:Crossover junction endonuclease mus81 [Coemansia biformis]